ncbi:OLC1v1004429C1 [Oldenlandia corymbosa var. corymbosa]|uniref:OLC1v1004429C1 n=1 Tax=Oldenlandia corymbosa var. corymbosa TaxID=529605 RepID=A0AAV1DD05_OLDCO|nr:OLC1v1004429C1 [Oldenlandia corymbosa var. corymbosa]
MQKNSKRSALVARRAWRFLRLALLWARKGGILKNRLMLAKVQLIKTIKHHQHNNSSAIGYGERELSFDETPVIHLKMSRPSSLRFKMPNIPCINPAASPIVDFHYDFSRQPESWDDYDDYEQQYKGEDQEIVYRKSFLNNDDDDEDSPEDYGNGGEEQEEGGIDMKAEEFIAKFYQQMKLQRQISYLQYTEMINRGAS